MDIQLLKDQLAGLEAKGKALRSDEALFLKAQGVDESTEKARTKLIEDEIDNANFKETMAELKSSKAGAIKEALCAIQDKMTAILPEGDAVIHIDDEGVLLIGWLKPEAKAPVAYHSLSGGEKAIFDPALISVLEAGLIIVEAAEMDEERLVESLKKLEQLKEQVIVNTWFVPKDVPKGWEIVKL